MKQEPIRNIKGFVKSYLNSKSGHQALNRSPFRKKTANGFEYVKQDNQMATAFQQALQE